MAQQPTDAPSSSNHNPLRTLLNGLKEVGKVMNKDLVPTQEPSSTSSPQSVPIPKLLVVNSAFSQKNGNTNSQLNGPPPPSLGSNLVGNSETNVSSPSSDPNNILAQHGPPATHSASLHMEANGRIVYKQLPSPQQQPSKITPSHLNAIPSPVMSRTICNNPPNSHSQSSVPNQKETTEGAANTLTQATLPSLSETAKPQDKISSILEGFKKMLEKKKCSAGSVPSQETFSGHSEGGSSNSEGVDLSPRANGSYRNTLNEQPLLSVVKREVIETDGNNDCSRSSVERNRLNFPLPIEFHGITISLLDDDDDDEPDVRGESNEKDVFDSSEINNEMSDMQNVTSSIAEVSTTNIVHSEMRDVNSENETVENETNIDMSNSLVYPNYQQSNSHGGDEVTLDSKNTSSQIKNFMSALGNVLHSTKSKIVDRSENGYDSLNVISQQSISPESLETNDGKSIPIVSRHNEDQSSNASKNSSLEGIGMKHPKPGPKAGFEIVPKEKVPAEIGQGQYFSISKRSSAVSTDLKQYSKPGPKSKKGLHEGIPATSCPIKSHTVGKNSFPQSIDLKKGNKRVRKPSFKRILQEDFLTNSGQGKPLAAKKGLPPQENIRSVNVKLDGGDEVINDKNNFKKSGGGRKYTKVNPKPMSVQDPKPSVKREVKRSMVNEKISGAASRCKNNIDSFNEMDDGVSHAEHLSLRTKTSPKKRRKPGSESKRGVKRLKKNDGVSVPTKNGPEESRELSSDDESRAESSVVKTYGQKSLEPSKIRSSGKKVSNKNKDTVEVVKEKEGKRIKITTNSENEEEKTQASREKSSDESGDDDNDDDDDDSMSDTSCSSVSESSDDADVEYVCKLCSKSYSKRSHLKKHMKTHYEGENKKVKKRFMCKGCRRKFSDKTGLQAHLLQRRYCFFDCTRAYWKKKESLLKTCRMCGKGQAKWKDLKKHSYRDLTCRLRFIDLVLENAKKTDKNKPDGEIKPSSIEISKNEKTKPFKENCGKQIKSNLKKIRAGQLSKSSGQSDNKKSMTSYYCPSCGTVFKTPIVFREHLNKVNKCKEFYLDARNDDCPVKLNYCPLCSIFMSSQSKLLTHQCTDRSRNVKCNICLKMFNDERGVKVHQRLTSCGMLSNKKTGNDGGVKVDIENKGSRVKSKSGGSVKTQAFNCVVCKKPFKQIQELLDHSYCHTDEGQFDCLDCNMTFVRYNSLVSHVIWHERKLASKESKTNDEGQKKTKVSDHGQKSEQLMEPVEKNTSQNNLEVTTKRNTNMKRKKDFLKGLSFSCFKCNQKFSTLTRRNEHVTNCGLQSFDATDGGNEINTPGAGRKSRLKNKQETENYFQCRLCKMSFKKNSFYTHIKAHQRRIIADIKKNKAQPLTAPIKVVCVICKGVYSTNRILITHTLLHKPRDIMKPVGKSFRISLNRKRGQPPHGLDDSVSENVPSAQIDKSPISPSHGSPTRKIAQKMYHVSCKLCHKKFFNVSLLKFHLKLSHKYLKGKPWINYVHYLQETELDAHSGDKSFGKSDKEPGLKTPKKASVAAVRVPNAVSRGMRSCEICQKLLHNIPRHMEDVHGLPRTMFLKTNRKSSSASLKHNTEKIKTKVHNKESVQPEKEINSEGSSDVGMTLQSSKECNICGETFSHAGLRWKHFFSHIEPSSVPLIKVEDILKGSLNLFEEDTKVEVDDMPVEISIAGDEVEGMSFVDDNDDNPLPSNVAQSITDEMPVSFDVNGLENSSNTNLAEGDEAVDDNVANQSSVQNLTVCNNTEAVSSDFLASGGDNSAEMMDSEESSIRVNNIQYTVANNGVGDL